MKQELLGSDQGIEPAIKNRYVVSLPGTTPEAMVDVKEEHVVIEEVDKTGIYLSFVAKEPNEVLRQ